ncbi:MAG: polysaccharide deacetylase family protein [Firmicutes bacterium]|nr:polysaccharide deacetylase family protein [Bacillota bacterium]
MKRAKKLVCWLLMAAIAFSSICLVKPEKAEAAGNKLVAFTFDDGPGRATPRLLDGLARYGAKATFFMVGSSGSFGVANHTELLERMVAEGHELANHTWGHAQPFSGLSYGSMRDEIVGVENYLFNAMGGSYHYWIRIPGGDDSSTVRSAVTSPIAYWSIDTRDWQVDNADYVYHSLMDQVFDGCIVILHDSHPTSVDAALRAIPELQAQGYECVTLSEMFRRKGITPEDGGWYRIVNGETIYDAYQAPQVDLQMSYTDTVVITVSGLESGLTYHYTTDGSYPKLNSPVYSGGSMSFPYGTQFRIVGYDSWGERTPEGKVSAGVSHAGVFNAKYYADRYGDLKKAFGYNEAALWSHFTEWGIYEGRIASPVFSIEYYMNHYGDLKAAFGSDRMAYVNHFQDWGMKEGRQGIETFNVNTFKNSRPDLQERYGETLPYYYYHYELYGDGEVTNIDTAGRSGSQGSGNAGSGAAQGESGSAAGSDSGSSSPTADVARTLTVMDGIDYAPVYDFEYYLAHNPDVAAVFGRDQEGVLRHFIKYGMDEGRRAKESFDLASYRNLYGDLRAAFGGDNRAYYMHYIQWGQFEGRQTTGAPKSLNPVTVYEGVDYAPVYDYAYYAAHNPDVVAVFGDDDFGVLSHFVRFGMAEGRKGNETFDVHSYKAKYGDVAAYYGDDLKGIYEHYLRFGRQEGRTS